MRSVTYSMAVSLDGYIVGPDGGFDWGAPAEDAFSLLHRRNTRGRRSPDGATAVRGDAVLGERRRESIARRRRARVGRTLEPVAEGRLLHHAVVGAGQCPSRVRQPGGGDRAVAGRVRRRRHRDRRCESRRRGSRAGSDRRVPRQGLSRAGWRWHSVLRPARATGGSRTRRDPHLQLEESSIWATAWLANPRQRVRWPRKARRRVRSTAVHPVPVARRPPASPGTTGGRARW